jgi:peptidoglycan lytic transglycosylase
VRRLVLIGVVAFVVAAAGLLVLHRDLPGWYAQAMPAWYARAVYPFDHPAAIKRAARHYDLDPALVAAIVYEESGFREDAVSDRGAVGLMQLLPSTAEEIAGRTGGDHFVAADLRDPRINIRYGSNYLRSLLDAFDGSTVEALAAYHAGERNVRGWMAAADGDLAVADIPFPDTRAYVAEVLRLQGVYRRAYDAELGPVP